MAMRKVDAEEAVRQLREAIRDEVVAEVHDATKPYRHNQWATYFVIMLVLIGGLASAARESSARRAQNCKIFKRTYRTDLDTVEKTREYLASLSAKDRGTKINEAIQANLPTLIRQTRAEVPPSYCGKQPKPPAPMAYVVLNHTQPRRYR
jgi:predicted short-subunit dehydrogenase-like oxidoreductase (DUF2520 family)